MQRQFKTVGQIGLGSLDILGIEQRYFGKAKTKDVRLLCGQSENPLKGFLRLTFGACIAGKGRILVPWTFHVHKKRVGKLLFQKHAHGARLQPVGINLDGQPKAPHVLKECGEIGNNGGFPAGNDNAVEPVLAALDVIDHVGCKQGRLFFRVPGNVRIVASGATQVASAEKQNTGGVTRPIAKAQRLESPKQLPGRRKFVVHAAVFCVAERCRLPCGRLLEEVFRQGLLAYPESARTF